MVAPRRVDSSGVVLNPDHVWPGGVPGGDTVDDYVKAAESEGFRCCDSAEWEQGVTKITFYYKTHDRTFTHVALHVAPGKWKSKLGEESDIEHPPAGVDCFLYGSGRIHMRRGPDDEPDAHSTDCEG